MTALDLTIHWPVEHVSAAVLRADKEIPEDLLAEGAAPRHEVRGELRVLLQREEGSLRLPVVCCPAFTLFRDGQFLAVQLAQQR